MRHSFFRNHDSIIAIVVVAVFVILFATESLFENQYRMINFDDGYNATVSANYMRCNEYRVSYPDSIVFYNLITTGVPVLLPTAWLYKAFGISSFTSGLVPLFYGLLSIVLVAYLLSCCLRQTTHHHRTVAATATILLFLSYPRFLIICVNLWGESASFAFLLLSLIFWQHYTNSQRRHWLFWLGASVTIAFLTKSAMIFILVSWIGILLVERYFTKCLDRRSLLTSCLGGLCGFALVDSFKYFQLGGWHNYLQWWYREWHNMLYQSSGYDGTPPILHKMKYLGNLFDTNRIFAILLLVIATFSYLYIVYRQRRQKSDITDTGCITMCICGILGASLLVYFVLLGGNGIANWKRQFVNIFFVRIFAAWICCRLSIWMVRSYREKTRWRHLQCAASLIFFLLLFPISKIQKSIIQAANTPTDYTNDYRAMNSLLAAIDQLPEDAVILTPGWFQTPQLSLYSQRQMRDFKTVNLAECPTDNTYFVVGFLIQLYMVADVETALSARLEQVYVGHSSDRISTEDNNTDFDLFSIYKVQFSNNHNDLQE